jgi:hypothetical protein
MGPWTFIRWESSASGSRARIAWDEGVRRVLILVIYFRSCSHTALHTSVFNEVPTYGIMATCQTYLAHLGVTAAGDGGWRWWHALLLSSGRCGAAPRVLQALKSAGDDGECSLNSWQPSIAVRIGRESSSRWCRVCDLAGKNLGSTSDYL